MPQTRGAGAGAMTEGQRRHWTEACVLGKNSKDWRAEVVAPSLDPEPMLGAEPEPQQLPIPPPCTRR